MTRDVRTFISHGQQTVEAHDGGAIVVGRDSSCAIVLDDALASRRHASFTMRGEKLFVRDLQSRNGLLVNGLPAEGETELFHGDQVTVGRSALRVMRQAYKPKRAESERAVPRVTDEEDRTEAGTPFDFLYGSTRKALNEGELSTAEYGAQSLFSILRRKQTRGSLDPSDLRASFDLSLDLVRATGDARWLEEVLTLHRSAGVPLDAHRRGKLASLPAALRPAPELIDEQRANPLETMAPPSRETIEYDD